MATVSFDLGGMAFEYDEEKNSQKIDVTRLISARLATEFERGVYYGKC